MEGIKISKNVDLSLYCTIFYIFIPLCNGSIVILASWFVGGVFDLIGFLRSTSDFCPPVNVHSTGTSTRYFKTGHHLSHCG